MEDMEASGGNGPLAGIRVLDLTINVLGPVCTQLLGDMGADVIKVEAPEGDQNRMNGPARTPGMSPFFLIMNRNKRSVVLDLKQPECLDALMKIVDTADVVVHSMRPSAAERLGIGYEALRARNPRIVYAHAPGFRGDGPRWDEPAFDDVIQGMSGLAALNGTDPEHPRYFPTVIADKFCGYVLASSISMALFHRERTGRGQKVQVPMFETLLQFNLFEHLWTAAIGDGPEGMGYTRMLSPHRRPYKTRDGHLCVLAVNDAQWRRLLTAIGHPHLLDDPRFGTMTQRMQNINELYGILSDTLGQRSSVEWSELLKQADVPHGPVNTLADLMRDPYLRDTGYFREYEHPSEGKLLMTSIPVSFTDSPGSYRLPPPRLGEHTEEVLASVGVDGENLGRVMAAGRRK
ncbi:CaiB/BaiF CoA transferase family protein [Ramlibacter sp.]|jgi:formyl-CoA transferase|uniref:CaiB/BaiF CoA transferase family protein n=1 Tax=Ramlibacter sp. TaxID=1917967 RepID=UPI002FC76CBE